MPNDDIYSFLELIRTRPAMYFGDKPSLSGLTHFLDGYTSALNEHKIPFERVGIWRPITKKLTNFHCWVRRRLGFGIEGSSWGYSQAILKHTDGDEIAALALFWELLDEYRALEAALDDPKTGE